MQDDDILTVLEFAILLKTDKRTIYKMIRDGKILAFRLAAGKNSHFRIRRGEIHRLINWNLNILHKNHHDN